MQEEKEWLEKVCGFFSSIGWATMWAGFGRFLSYRENLYYGRRKLARLPLIWELPTAIACAKIGTGIAFLLKIPPGDLADAVVIASGYLGPRTLEILWARVWGPVNPGNGGDSKPKL